MRAAIRAGGDVIRKKDIPTDETPFQPSMKEFLEGKLDPYISKMAETGVASLYDSVVSEVEKSLFEIVLKETGWNQLRAARALGINRNTLRMKIKQYGLRQPTS